MKLVKSRIKFIKKTCLKFRSFSIYSDNSALYIHNVFNLSKINKYVDSYIPTMSVPDVNNDLFEIKMISSRSKC